MNQKDLNRLRRKVANLHKAIHELDSILADPLDEFTESNEANILALNDIRIAQDTLKLAEGSIVNRLAGRMVGGKPLTYAGVTAKLTVGTSYSLAKGRKIELVNAVLERAVLSSRPGESDAEAMLRVGDDCFNRTPRWSKIAELGLDPDAYREAKMTAKIELS